MKGSVMSKLFATVLFILSATTVFAQNVSVDDVGTIYQTAREGQSAVVPPGSVCKDGGLFFSLDATRPPEKGQTIVVGRTLSSPGQTITSSFDMGSLADKFSDDATKSNYYFGTNDHDLIALPSGVDDKTEYFYSFTAGPGEVNVTLDVKAEKGTAVSSVDIALFDAKSNKLLSTYANPDHGGSKRAVESTKVRGTQTLLLEVTVSQGVDSFKIKLGGAIKIAPSTDDGGTPAPDSPAPPADAPAQPSNPPDDETTLLPDPQPAASAQADGASAQQTSTKLPPSKKGTNAVAAPKSGGAQAVTSAARLNAPQARLFARLTGGGVPLPSAVAASVRPQITVRSESLPTPNRVAIVISVTNWRDFAGKFSAAHLPKTLPPSSCDHKTGVRLVLMVYDAGGHTTACHNVAALGDLELIRTMVPGDKRHGGFYVVLTDLAGGKSVRSNTARVDSQ
jgi:hypothetical protein